MVCGQTIIEPTKTSGTGQLGVRVTFGVFGGLLIGLYFLVIVAVAILVVWVLILAIVFLRLRISEIRGAAGSVGPREQSLGSGGANPGH
jgi:uncharacterized membrane protein